MTAAIVRWHGDKVTKLVTTALVQMVNEAAALIEAQAKVNIVDNGQVDTGFMVNSVYFVSALGSNYEQVQSEALGRANKGFASVITPSDDLEAVVAIAAEYAAIQETRLPFLYPAAEQVAATMGAQIVQVGREVLS